MEYSETMSEIVDPSFDTRYLSNRPLEATSGAVVSFDNPPAYSRSIRGTALVFNDPSSQLILERIKRIAPSNASALVIGATGTGKELIARQIHQLSGRASKQFIAVNCAALPEQLVESELFGHEKGAFTGASLQKKGWFEVADGGTLFLDEIGDLSPSAQVKLLRVLQEREISRVGGRTSIPIDIRLIAATNVHLQDAVRAGRFREDLYYRLNVAQIHLPSLRERPGDILPLAEHFVRVYCEHLNITQAQIGPAAQQRLLTYPWPGNIRELENVIHHSLLVMGNGVIQPSDLQLPNFQTQAVGTAAPVSNFTATDITGSAQPLEQVLIGVFERGGDALYSEIEARVVRCAFEYCQNNQLQTAKLLGISRNILRHRLKLYGML